MFLIPNEMVTNHTVPENASIASGLKHDKMMRAVYFSLGQEKRETLAINDYPGEKHSGE